MGRGNKGAPSYGSREQAATLPGQSGFVDKEAADSAV